MSSLSSRAGSFLQNWRCNSKAAKVPKLRALSASAPSGLSSTTTSKDLRAASASDVLEAIRSGAISFSGLKDFLSKRDDSPFVNDLLSKIEQWETFDVNLLEKATNGKPLFAVVKAVFDDLGLMETEDFCMDPAKLDAFLHDLEAGYNRKKYHNSTHAADVVHAKYLMMKKDKLWQKLKPWERLALVLAAAGHDVGHPGLTNKHLVDTQHAIAVQYGPNSPNEQLHAATTISLIREHELLPPHLLHPISQLITKVILTTDMAVHGNLLEKFDQYVKLYGGDLGTWTDAEARSCAMSVMLHMADISNIAKPCSLAKIWAICVTQEAQQQGDLERAHGMQVAPLFDRALTNIPASQSGFIALFNLREAFVSLAAIAPAFGQMALQHLDANVTFYNSLVKAGVKTL